MWLELAIIFLLILANGVFAGAELAIISIRKSRLHELVDGGNRRARSVARLRAQPERFLATVQIGITVIGATAAAFGGASVAERWVPVLQHLGLGTAAHQVALVVVIVMISYLSLILGELVPKSLALKYAEPYGLIVAKPLEGIAWLGRPLVWFLTASSNVVLKLFGDKTTFTESRISPEELQAMVEEAAKAGTLHPGAGAMASRAFTMNELVVSEVMVPRRVVIALPRSATASEIQRLLLEEGHSRMPVYEGSLDNVVGYVIARDLLALVWESQLVVLDDAIRPAIFMPETKPAVDALQELQRKRTHLAIVVDELGGMSGIITIEDLVEEIVGEIFSEHEQPTELLTRERSGSLLAPGTAPLRDLNRELGIELPEGDGFSTIAGLLLDLSGRIPETGATFDLNGYIHIEVVDASPRRIRMVRIEVTPKPAEPPE